MASAGIAGGKAPGEDVTETTRIIYFGVRDLDYARVRAAVRGSQRPGITLYRVVDLRQAMINELFHSEAICLLSPRFEAGKTLQLMDWSRITGDVGPVYQLRHVPAGQDVPDAPDCLGLKGYVPTREMTTRGLESFIDRSLGRSFFRFARKRSAAGGFVLVTE